MVVRSLLFVLMLGSGSIHATSERPHSQRYLSIYATDITDSFAYYDQVKEMLRKYVIAHQSRDKYGMKKHTSTALYVSLLANIKQPRGFNVQSDLVEIRDLAIYSFDKKTFAQFDVFDLASKRSFSMKSWFMLSRGRKGWIIESILEHFDPDARP